MLSNIAPGMASATRGIFVTSTCVPGHCKVPVHGCTRTYSQRLRCLLACHLIYLMVLTADANMCNFVQDCAILYILLKDK
jgi:hypothetical protein